MRSGEGDDYNAIDPNIVVGRATDVEGPSVDRAGVPMTEGGGTLLLDAAMEGGRLAGPGPNAVLRETDADYLVYHAYDIDNDGAPVLRIRRLGWSEHGWPSAGGAARDRGLKEERE